MCMFLGSIIESFSTSDEFPRYEWNSWKNVYGGYNIFAKKSHMIDDDSYLDIVVVVVEKIREYSEILLYNPISGTFFSVESLLATGEEATNIADIIIAEENDLTAQA